jgi:probable rRNA maturation factor
MRVQWAMSQVFHRQAGKWQRLAEKTTVFVFVSSRKMRRLNSRFRAKNRPTDVLSFAPTEPNSLGEIVICRDVLRRQAREQGWGPTNELIFVAAHGWLHLLGWDHERSPDEEREMARLQDQIYAWAVDAFPLPRRGAEG